eukprot:TRINITY_DN3568_c2_g4_i1.p1 TRINITY_DN3568_c2_g4~~TRINITY_DN3568_c2_g4_i1.p1  ORF type:complete len:394 (+),score=69.36 TRINITY_DN3568_c2_g4_i1:45-1184(+)
MFQSRQQQEQNEAREFIQRLLVTAAVQGVVMGGGMWMLNRAIHGSSSKTVKIKGKWLRLTNSEASLVESLTDVAEIDGGFEKVGGLETAKRILMESIVAPFQYSQVFSQGSLRTSPKGVLLFGPPGTGKTLLAKAIAKACQASFLEVKVENLFGKWLGESEQTVAAIFTLAKKAQPCIIFVDELDSLLSHRSSSDAHAYSNAKTIFLRHWDGFSTNESKNKIVVIGASNCPEVLDSAVMRRMPVKIEIPYPNLAERENILRILLKEEDTSKVDFAEIAKCTVNYSGADLKELCQHACRVQALELISKKGIQPTPPPPPPSFFETYFGASRTPVPPSPYTPPPLDTALIISCTSVVKSNENFSDDLLKRRAAKPIFQPLD